MRAILTYHSLDDSGSVISLAPAQFARHLAWLEEGGVEVVSLAALLASPDDAARDRMALTFDDGFASVATVAAPLLAARGWPYTVFVVSGQVGRDNAWPHGADAGIPVLPLMDWDTLGGLVADGAEVGAHTRTHRRLPTLDGAALSDELAGAAEAIASRLGARPASFAYPYGDLSDAVATAAAREFRHACTTEFRVLEPSEPTARLPRLDSYYFRQPRQLHRWGSLAFRSHLRLRGSMRQVRQLLPR